MDEVCLRFPHICEQINTLLNDQSLVKLKETSRILYHSIINQKAGRFIYIRKIQRSLPKGHNSLFTEDWNIVLKIKSVDILEIFAFDVQNFYKTDQCQRRRELFWSPMHIAAESGNLNLCKYLSQKIGRNNSKGLDGCTPVHFAAQSGHFEVYKFLSENEEDKNPKTNNGMTPLHLAAKNGHLKIYQLICEFVYDKNPCMAHHLTPLHLAAKYGHANISDFICKNSEDKHPKLLGYWLKPIELALHNGQLKTAMVIIKNDLMNLPFHILRHLQFWSKVVVSTYIISMFIAIFLHCVFDMNIDMSFVPKLKIEPISIDQGAGNNVVIELINWDSNLWLMAMLLTYFTYNLVNYIIDPIFGYWTFSWTEPKLDY